MIQISATYQFWGIFVLWTWIILLSIIKQNWFHFFLDNLGSSSKIETKI